MEAEDELRKTDRMQLCAGAMRRDDYDETLFTTKLRDHVLTRKGLHFSTKCLGQVPKQEESQWERTEEIRQRVREAEEDKYRQVQVNKSALLLYTIAPVPLYDNVLGSVLGSSSKRDDCSWADVSGEELPLVFATIKACQRRRSPLVNASVLKLAPVPFSAAATPRAKRPRQAPPNPRRYKCELCSYSSIYKQALNRHYRVHTGERPYQCELCPRTFAQKCNMKLHLRRHGACPYQCRLCNRIFRHGMFRGGGRFSSRGASASVPQNVRRFHCSFCNYSTIYKQTLQRHHRTHTGERPFECEFCLKTFAQKCNMKAHQRLHTGACPYRCQFCQLGFSRRELLTEHLQQEHELQLAFKCGYCSGGFLTRHELWRHLRTCSPWGAPTPDAATIVASVVASVPASATQVSSTQPTSSPTTT
ncbi:hypothetical protein HPB50_021403 [Hyalomma asiaticum]|uniref:Uncharacterized protein n=1 Tax=Hyalomma asiaticum TaxID=266040 RepID=A0ACB7RNX8_HYAAI|nr:hypothetical protein HPB50_021403 [Hyalomma asiaticum]